METLKRFKAFADEMTASNSQISKQAVLAKYKNDSDVVRCLSFLFNPYVVTGISDKKAAKDTAAVPAAHLKSTLDALDFLKANNGGSDAIVASLREFESSVLGGDQELVCFFRKLISKNLPLGIGADGINKALPGLVPTFSVQLANKYFERPESVEGKTFALTTKIDGGRIIALKRKGEVSFYTRAGQSYEGLVDLEEELKASPEDDICLDGEITLLDKGALTSKDQYKRTMMITRKDGVKHGVKMLVFDMLTADEFVSQSCDTPYDDRRKSLDSFFGSSKHVFFDLLPVLYRGDDAAQIIKWLNYNVAHGEEGVMINVCSAPYRFKRTSDLLKVKLMKSYDMELTGFEEGSGRLAGTLGAALVRYKDGQTVKVGSGFSDEQRSDIWANKGRYLGTIIEVQYFEETTNADGGSSLRFPVFRDFRPDKETADF
jgi:DNA ligase 1